MGHVFERLDAVERVCAACHERVSMTRVECRCAPCVEWVERYAPASVERVCDSCGEHDVWFTSGYGGADPA